MNEPPEPSGPKAVILISNLLGNVIAPQFFPGNGKK